MARIIRDANSPVIVDSEDEVEVNLTNVEVAPFISLIVPGLQGPAGEVGPASTVPGPPGPPGTSLPGVARFITVHFNTLSDQWLVAHDLDNPTPDVKVLDINGEEIFADVSYPDANHVLIKFAYETTGVVQLG